MGIFYSFEVFFLLAFSTLSYGAYQPDFSFLDAPPEGLYACSSAASNTRALSPVLTTNLTHTMVHRFNNYQISAYQALKQLKKTDTLLVDVRPAQEFNQFSIPGSLNIPAYLLKNKAFLKGKKLFLINDGSQSLNLSQVCHELGNMGIETHFVTGGLNSWSKVSHVLNAYDAFNAPLDMMTPVSFSLELSLPDILLISLSAPSVNTEHDPLLSQHTNYIDFKNNVVLLTRQIKDLLKKNPYVVRLFIYNQDGQIPTRLKSHLNQQFRQSIFYLKGGELAFNHYKKNHLALLKRLKHPPQRLYRCRG